MGALLSQKTRTRLLNSEVPVMRIDVYPVFGQAWELESGRDKVLLGVIVKVHPNYKIWSVSWWTTRGGGWAACTLVSRDEGSDDSQRNWRGHFERELLHRGTGRVRRRASGKSTL